MGLEAAFMAAAGASVLYGLRTALFNSKANKVNKTIAWTTTGVGAFSLFAAAQASVMPEASGLLWAVTSAASSLLAVFGSGVNVGTNLQTYGQPARAPKP